MECHHPRVALHHILDNARSELSLRAQSPLLILNLVGG